MSNGGSHLFSRQCGSRKHYPQAINRRSHVVMRDVDVCVGSRLSEASARPGFANGPRRRIAMQQPLPSYLARRMRCRRCTGRVTAAMVTREADRAVDEGGGAGRCRTAIPSCSNSTTSNDRIRILKQFHKPVGRRSDKRAARPGCK